MSSLLDKYQLEAIERLKSGNILVGGTGSGKSRTALAFYEKENGGNSIERDVYIPMINPKKLYIITTAKKRDLLEWDKEIIPFYLDRASVVIDSWNNIKKYVDVRDSWFIFDEQRVVGYGSWTKTFIKISKNNQWLLVTATPGDKWLDYLPVFIANGFYKNKTAFVREHVIYKPYFDFPVVDRYVNVGKLIKHRDQILVNMNYIKKTKTHHEYLFSTYNKEWYDEVKKSRWNRIKNAPIKNSSELCYLERRVSNSDESKLRNLRNILNKHLKIIIFYNFNYELETLLSFGQEVGLCAAQLNGHRHETIPKTKSWLYLVQYSAGSEAWNCVETDTIVFYSPNYSYRTMIQAAGRIDRRNTPFVNLYYYHLVTKSPIDLAIEMVLAKKESFNESRYLSK